MATTREINKSLTSEAKVHSRLTEAAASNNFALVKELLPKCPMNWQDSLYGNTALHWAVANSNVSIAVYLANHASITDINKQDLTGKTALHFAIAKGWDHIKTTKSDLPQSCVIQVLIKKTCLNLQDKYGNTPLHIALMRRDLRCAEQLLKNGAKLDIQNAEGQLPLDMLDMDFIQVTDFIKSYACVFTLNKNTWDTNTIALRKLLKHFSIPKKAIEEACDDDIKPAEDLLNQSMASTQSNDETRIRYRG